MSFLEVIEVAIGLVFVWILMSLAVMQTQEWIVGLLEIRADGLEEAIQGMLAEPKPAQNVFRRTWEQFFKIIRRYVPERPPLVEEFYAHPLIKGLAQGGKKPSYIPTETFAQALFDVVMSAGTPESVIQKTLERFEAKLETLEVKLTPEQVGELRTTLNGLLSTQAQAFQDAYAQFKVSHPQLAVELAKLGIDESDVGQVKAALEKLSGQLADLKLSPKPEHVAMLQEALGEITQLSQVQAALDQLRQQHPEIEPVLDALKPALDELMRVTPGDEMLAQIMNGAAALALTNPDLKQTLDVLVGHARAYATGTESAIVIARTNVMAWFDDTMDRASGWYKRNREVGAFAIGLIFAALINVDSVNIATHLWREPTLRQAVVAQAERYQLPADDTQPAVGPQDLDALSKTYEDLEQSLTLLDIPIGWEFVEVKPSGEAGACELFKPEAGDAWGFRVDGRCVAWQAPQGWSMLGKLAGLIVTAAAATLGAPFWFDILQKLIGIRSSGKVPEPSNQGGQKQT